MDVNDTLNDLLNAYGDGANGESPTAEQWRHILCRDPDRKFSLVNLFKFNDMADYGPGEVSTLSGQDAFQSYAQVSIPSMGEAGGEFLTVAPFAGNFIGQGQDWDLVAIGTYPDLGSFLGLYLNPKYIEAYQHRKAAVARQQVMVLDHDTPGSTQ